MQDSPASISFRVALKFWFKLGLISFGGPAGQIAIMHQELVERRRWISERRFLHALNYCMLLPGPEAQQLATYAGWLMHRTVGGLAAGALFVLPSLLLLIALSWAYASFGHTALVSGLIFGVKPAVVAIVAQAAYRIGGHILQNSWLWAIAVAAFIAVYFGNAPFPLVVISAAVIGFVGGRVAPARFRVGSAHVGAKRGMGVAIIDDDTPIPAHARFSLPRLLMTLVIGGLLWLLPIALLLITQGWNGTLTQMSWFFTKAALLTFGGAYAVLPYVYQGAVLQYHWLTATQMIDGLALGETTPGPLIMVVVFVAFVGAYLQPMFGAEHLFLAGAAAAVLVTWFTFLPSFMFILVGGPLVEATHGELTFTAPLTAITAAVVGVILSLALFFARHVLWPADSQGAFSWSAALLAAAALVALQHYQRAVIEVILSCALGGLIIVFLQNHL